MLNPPFSSISSPPIWKVALDAMLTTTGWPSEMPFTEGSSRNTTIWNWVLLSTLVIVPLMASLLASSMNSTRFASIVPIPFSLSSTSTIWSILTQVKSCGLAVHPARSKSSNTVLLSTLTVKDWPLRLTSVNWLVPTAVTWPSNSSSSSISWSSLSSWRCLKCAMVTDGLIERSFCTEELTSKSSLIPTTEFMSIVTGNGVPDKVTVEVAKLGVNWQTVLLAQEPIAAPE